MRAPIYIMDKVRIGIIGMGNMGRFHANDLLDGKVARGELAIDDLDMAAEQFSELCKAKLWTRAVFGIQTRFTDAEIADVVANAVDTFMARYGV